MEAQEVQSSVWRLSVIERRRGCRATRGTGRRPVLGKDSLRILPRRFLRQAAHRGQTTKKRMPQIVDLQRHLPYDRDGGESRVHVPNYRPGLAHCVGSKARAPWKKVSPRCGVVLMAMVGVTR